PQGSGYALACFPDVWKDATVEKNEIEKIWRRLIKNWGKEIHHE
ncbi:MAG: xylose isomerase, partial [Candidatus Latescibacteria bacterium]|nr:xylose isomerase [Candidatus Latescibacterota bacterium]